MKKKFSVFEKGCGLPSRRDLIGGIFPNFNEEPRSPHRLSLRCLKFHRNFPSLSGRVFRH